MMKIGIVMDPIEDINVKKDTSFAMLLAAQNRGWEIHYMTLKDLYLLNGIAYATTTLLNVHDNESNWFTFGEQQEIPLSSLSAILMRKDPPFDTEYIYATYLLERAEQEGTLIVNKPQSLRDCNEKLFTAWFADLTPETLVTRDSHRFKAFHKKHQDIILKPLDGMGGTSIFRIGPNDPNLSVIIETLTALNKHYCMAQKYIPEIAEGDKRIIIVDGHVIPYCLARIPQQGETRGNLAAGGKGRVQPLSESDFRIAQRVAPELVKRGLIFVGLDIIGDKLTEINVTSPTGVRQIEAMHPSISISNLLMDAIERRIKMNK